MKVGVLTFSEADNYGAMLQAFALIQTIKSIGCDCSLIRYRNKNIWKSYNYVGLSERHSFLNYLKKNFELCLFKKRKQAFEEFRAQCNITKVFSEDDVYSLAKIYDKFVVGSDQVWNPRNTLNDKHFLLDFISDSNKKISYAASFGNVRYFNEFGENALKLLDDFSYISCRENDGSIFIKEKLNKPAQVVLDPVLLLDKKSWNNVIYDKSNIHAEYIFVYSLQPNIELIKYVSLLSKNLHLRVIVIPAIINSVFKNKRIKRSKVVLNAGPNEMLELIKNAKCVVTDSFHGTALSIVFEKQFCVFKDHKKDNTNSRIETMLNALNLLDRCTVDCGCNIDIMSPIDYKSVNSILEKKRAEAVSYLKKSLILSL